MSWILNLNFARNVSLRTGLFVRRVCLAFDKLSFSQVIKLYKRFRVMYGEVRDKVSSEADVAGYIVNETRDLSLDDLMDHSDHSIKSWSVL